MREDKKKLENDSSTSLNLDSKQIEELDILIESLKKETVMPRGKAGEQVAAPKAGQV